MDIAYHIVTHTQSNQSTEQPIDKHRTHRDCLCRIRIPIDRANEHLTISDLISLIAQSQSLTNYEEYNWCKNITKPSKRKLLVGKSAKTKEDIEYKTILENKTINATDLVFKVFEQNKQEQEMCFFILIDESEFEIKKIKQEPTKTSRRRMRKRTRSPSNDKEHHKPLKRGKKSKSYDTLWLLTDASLSGEYQTDSKETVDRSSMVRRLLSTIVKSNWKTNERIALFSFPPLKEWCAPLKRSALNADLILRRFDCIGVYDTKNNWNDLILKSIQQLQHRIQQIQHSSNSIGNHRIVLFLNKHGAVGPKNDKRVNHIKQSLENASIIFDCIQVSHSHRPNNAIFEIAQHNGKYFTPSNNTAEWESVVRCHDFVHPNKRNVSQDEAIVLD